MLKTRRGDVSDLIGESYGARKQLFAKGLKQGRLTAAEIEEALGKDALTATERWLLYYSLRAAGIEILESPASETLTNSLS
jgi:hypothetical protein